MTFEEAHQAGVHTAKPGSDDRPMHLRWRDLLVPLPELTSPAWAYALTYPVHQKETGLADIFSFEKRTMAESASAPIEHRPALDYEAEVALLLHRGEPERFGFLMANDLTDRAIQLQTYDRRRPAPGFSAAKSFPGALRLGPLLVMADGSLWPKLEVRLEVNGTLRQQVRAKECLLTPHDFHQQVFANQNAGDWAVVLTGTTGGTIFQSPTPRQRFQVLARSGFSVRRARDKWLRQFQFLGVGDRLEMKSDILGMSDATIVAE